MSIQTPPRYKPFRRLNLCTNSLNGTRVPFAVGDQPILLIGSGDRIPLVWLAARVLDGPSLVYIVEESRSRNPGVIVVVDPAARAVLVTARGPDPKNDPGILQVRAVSDDEAIVDGFNLSPLGFQVRGDASGLQVGGNRYVGNDMPGLDVAFSFPFPAKT